MTSYQNMPLYSVNIKIFLKLGLIGSGARIMRFLLGLVLILTYSGQLINFCKTWNEDIGESGMNFHVVALIMHSVIRFFVVLKKAKKFERFFQRTEQWFTDIERNGDPQIVSTLQNIIKKTQKQTKMIFCAGAVGTIAGFIYSVSFDKRKLLVAVQYPFINSLQTPYFQLFFLIQSVVLAPIFMLFYLSYTNIFLTSLMFGELVLKDLCSKLRNIHSENETTMLNEFKECIAYHVKIIDLCDDLEDLISIDGFFHLALFGLMLCMLLFFLSMMHYLQHIITALGFIVFDIYLLGVSYYYANKLAIESVEVTNAVYGTPWYRGNMEMRKCVIIMMSRCQKPLQITAGGLYLMTMENFQAILRLSYSYFSLLRGFNQQ